MYVCMCIYIYIYIAQGLKKWGYHRVPVSHGGPLAGVLLFEVRHLDNISA